MRLSCNWRALSAALLGSISAACADTGDDEPSPSQLDRLRVLAIAAEPPDLVPGESATLAALVFEPAATPVGYAWSWCPVGIDVEGGTACPIEESLWAELWTSAGLAGAPPAYDLGGEPTAVLAPRFEADSAQRLCDVIGALGPAAEPARIACADGFEASVVLRALGAGDEEIAIKRVPFLPEGTPPEARNHNPGPLGDVSARLTSTDEVVADGTLRAGRTYTLHVDLDAELSELVPEGAMEPVLDGAAGADRAEPATGEGRETLVLSWFVTQGELADPDDGDESFDPFEDDTQRTVYVPGQSTFDALLENGWALPPTADQPQAELVLVLRDGRGGVAWRRDRFALTRGEP
jgi:hypothetical protein